MSKTFSHKLGTSRAGAGTRLWLEGKRLSDHGFTHGQPFERRWSEGKLILRVVEGMGVFETLERSNRGIVSGSAERPIIDITGQQVAQAFPSGRVTATWSHGRVVVAGE